MVTALFHGFFFSLSLLLFFVLEDFCIRLVGTRSIYNRLIKIWFRLAVIFVITIKDRNANLNSHTLYPTRI